MTGSEPPPAGRPAARALRPIRELHADWAGPLYVFAVRRLEDRQVAEEVVQDTLVRAWRAADRFDPDRGSEATWLFTIARRLVIDRLRRRDARPDATGGLPDELAGEDHELDRVLETWQLADALDQLSDAHREAIVLCHHRGLTAREAAERLGVPVGTVKSRLFYGLKALRLQLEEMGVVS